MKKLKEKICEVCGKVFIPTGSNQKTCSNECKKIKKKEYNKEYNKANKFNISIQKKEYYKQNKDKKNSSSKKRYNRLKNDLSFKLPRWYRSQIHRCLNSNKTEHTFDILGYTPEQLKQRLEMNFKLDMNWSNHGTLWHIDHRKPLCKFNFVLPDGTPNYEQIRLANSLANLQPLYVTENLSKGGR